MALKEKAKGSLCIVRCDGLFLQVFTSEVEKKRWKARVGKCYH